MPIDEHPRILIIDNDEGVVRAIETRLESVGYVCVTAGTGAAGISAFNAGDVDLVITDLNMPTGDGITVVRSIRKASSVPIIVVTGFRDEFREELGKLAHVTVLRKPFDSNDLVDLVETELTLSESLRT